MIDRHEIIWGIIAPPVLMAAGIAATAWLPAIRRWLPTGVLIALVFALCQFGFRGGKLPGSDVNAWPAWIAVAAGALTWCALSGHGPMRWQVPTRAALTGIATWLLLMPRLGQITSAETALWLAGLTLAWTTLILVWERAHAATTPGVSATTLVALAGFSALVLLMFNTLVHAQFALIALLAMAVAMVAGWWRPAWYASAGPVTVLAVVLPMVWVLGERYASLPLWCLPLLGLAGLAPLVATLPRTRAWAAWKRLALTQAVLLLVLSPVLVAGIRLTIQMLKEPSYGY
jgi:hypothetical protein